MVVAWLRGGATELIRVRLRAGVVLVGVRRENSRGSGRECDDGSRGSGFAMNSIGVVARNVEEPVSVTIELSRSLNFPPLANVLLLWRRIQPFATIRMKFYYISLNWSQWGTFLITILLITFFHFIFLFSGRGKYSRERESNGIFFKFQGTFYYTWHSV